MMLAHSDNNNSDNKNNSDNNNNSDNKSNSDNKNNSDNNDENNKVGLTLLGLILSSSLIVGLILLARCNLHKMISTSCFCLLSPLLSSLPERMQPVKITNMFQDVQKEIKYTEPYE